MTRARAFDWSTGDVLIDKGGTWRDAEPEGERISFALATQLGECGYDSTLGVDWATLDLGSPSVLREAERRVRSALERYVRRGRFRLVRVECARVAAEGIACAVEYSVGGSSYVVRSSALRTLDRRELVEPEINNVRLTESGARRVTESGAVRVWE